MKSTDYMRYAFCEAEAAAQRGEVPVGAVLVDGQGAIVARAGNRVEENRDPTAHAEMLILRTLSEQAARGECAESRAAPYDLYVTLEPCTMCAAALSLARIRRIYFAAYDPKGGGIEHGAQFYNQPTCHHRPEVIGGLDEERGRRLLQDFFGQKRGSPL